MIASEFSRYQWELAHISSGHAKEKAAGSLPDVTIALIAIWQNQDVIVISSEYTGDVRKKPVCRYALPSRTHSNSAR